MGPAADCHRVLARVWSAIAGQGARRDMRTIVRVAALHHVHAVAEEATLGQVQPRVVQKREVAQAPERCV